MVLLGEVRNSTGESPEHDQVAEAGATVKDLEGQLEKARVKDPDAAERVRRGIEELKAQIDLIEQSQKWPSLLNRLEEVKQLTTDAVQGSNERKDSERLEKLLVEARSAVDLKDAVKLEKSISYARISHLGDLGASG